MLFVVLQIPSNNLKNLYCLDVIYGSFNENAANQSIVILGIKNVTKMQNYIK